MLCNIDDFYIDNINLNSYISVFFIVFHLHKIFFLLFSEFSNFLIFTPYSATFFPVKQHNYIDKKFIINIIFIGTVFHVSNRHQKKKILKNKTFFERKLREFLNLRIWCFQCLHNRDNQCNWFMPTFLILHCEKIFRRKTKTTFKTVQEKNEKVNKKHFSVLFTLSSRINQFKYEQM
jgi:hypothetical protein